ncbi:hypothetical protein [Sedimentibacter sp.]|uniref:hypothetical protein n=1 Tax=Sedimentibacter sp. TaxID=1960295 RepID=UPI0028962FA4|nr:hypothetical protein [Sedimentibacter sp.]
MKRKHLFIITITLLSIMVTLSSCTNENNDSITNNEDILKSMNDYRYDLPLDSNDVEAIISQKSLEWKIDSQDSFRDGHAVYLLKKDLEQFSKLPFLLVDLEQSENMRHIIMSYVSLDSPRDKFINRDEFFEIFDLALTFYSNSDYSEVIFNDFVDYSPEKSLSEYRITWYRRIGDASFQISYYPADDENYGLNTRIVIANPGSNERMRESERYFWLTNIEEMGADYTEVTIEEMLKMQLPNDVTYYLTESRLKDIKETKIISEGLSSFTNMFVNLDKKDYLSAKLEDDTGSVNVYIQPSTFTIEELEKTRNNKVISVKTGSEQFYIVNVGEIIKD